MRYNNHEILIAGNVAYFLDVVDESVIKSSLTLDLLAILEADGVSRLSYGAEGQHSISLFQLMLKYKEDDGTLEV